MMESVAGDQQTTHRVDFKDKCKSYSSFVKSLGNNNLLATSNKSPASKKSVRTLGRTDIKLLEKPDQPVKGMIIYIIYTFLKSLCFLCASFLYRRNPDLGSFQMLVMRSMFALVCQAIYVNKDLKKAVWDDINRSNVCPLIVRSSQGSITNIVNYTVTKFLPLTMIAIVNNLGPPVTVLMAFIVLKERVKKFEILMITLTVAGILTVVVGGEQDPSTQDGMPTITKTTRYILYGVLFFNPFLSAFGTISMRKMKKFHEAVVSFYLNWSIGITSLIVILALGQGFEPIAKFDWVSWLLSFGTGLSGVSSQTARFIALKM
jgi:drug/metabolite transporter (DMT)-like permease